MFSHCLLKEKLYSAVWKQKPSNFTFPTSCLITRAVTSLGVQ